MRLLEKLKKSLKTPIFGVILGLLMTFSPLLMHPSYAIPANTTETTETTTADTDADATETDATNEAPAETTESNETEESETSNEEENVCRDQTGVLSWLICPSTGIIAKAIDAVYDFIAKALVVKPISSDSESPIYLVWQYMRDLTNIVFVIVFLVVILSQISGLGISNYGVKKALPRLIVVAVLVNLSFIICSLAVDLSNVIGISIRGLFTSIQESAIASGGFSGAQEISWTALVGALVGGGAVAGLAISLTGGLGALFWLLVPALIGGILAAFTAFITLALRQTLIAMLIMISPLAFVAYILPNTESWFKKWYNIFFSMLIFFPMFGLLFGASQLAGWAIIASADNAFGVILGMAAQVMPLFLCLPLLKMSNTALGAVSSRLSNLSSSAKSKVSVASAERRALARAKYLSSASGRVATPSRYLARYLNDRKERRADDLDQYNAANKARGLAYSRGTYHKKDGSITRRGEQFYRLQYKGLQNQETVKRIENDFNKGLGEFAKPGTMQRRRLNKLDNKTFNSVLSLRAQEARGQKIEYDNAKSMHESLNRALDAHQLQLGNPVRHAKDLTVRDLENFNTVQKITGSDLAITTLAAANATYEYDIQIKSVQSKLAKNANFTEATKDITHRVMEFAKSPNSSQNIDFIIPSLREINNRGDTDIVYNTLGHVFADNKVVLGTHASQALSSFCMFDVGDGDPFIRRFGKYINVETAQLGDGEGKRHKQTVDFAEFVKGVYDNGNGTTKNSKYSLADLVKGTSFKNVERTAFDNIRKGIAAAYSDAENEEMLKKQMEVFKAVLPNLASDHLQYLSGSEQINNFTTYLTGLRTKDGGKTYEVSDGNGDMKERLDRTNTFIGALVPNQLASFKSDVFLAVVDLYRRQALAEYDSGKYQTPDDYDPAKDISDYYKNHKITPKEATEEQKAAAMRYAIGTQGAREKFSEAVNDSVFNRLQNSARSGALNNAKTPVLDFLGIKVDNSRNARKSKHEQDDDGSSSYASPDPGSYYSPSDIQDFINSIDAIYDRNNPDFYHEAMHLIRDRYGLGLIAKGFDDYYQARYAHSVQSVDNDDLYHHLIDLLKDENNY